MYFSKRINNIKPSATLALSTQAKKMQAQGLDVINLTIGEPDFNTPSHIKNAAIAAIERGDTDFYTPAAGILSLREELARKITQAYQVETTSDQLALTTGGKYALYALMQALIEKDDEVLIPLPYWVSYGEQVKMAEGCPVFVHPAVGQMKVTVAQLEQARTDKTKLVIINSPQNPSGTVYTEKELWEIGNWAVKHQIMILADDMYGMLVYNGNQFKSLWELSPEIRRQTIVVSGFSKTYAMTGWRVGYVLADPALIAKLSSFLSHSTSNLTAVSQYAALAALQGDQSCIQAMRLEYQRRLNLIYPQLQKITGIKLLEKPAGAFYMFPDISEAVKLTGFATTEDFVFALLTEAHVAVIPGSAFGMENHIRLSYAASLENLNEAVARIDHFIKKHINN
ncbi:pyridoxal phosphate-dependent aminotransferase [Ligilactobacillus ceti]|uniref:Aminotransferase n=1 Tax=Ligilactobacillus ceti DSM 22408 TaxID=1122146 RepID=A0A0R2KHT1_9LACO|nr:pyridoxal phosphate-dependent aminotransferase [Ligilactobacillus ceti]KRN88905.1 aspartate aminotransferase [Ligilactobacillus ceti DSM 22408]